MISKDGVGEGMGEETHIGILWAEPIPELFRPLRNVMDEGDVFLVCHCAEVEQNVSEEPRAYANNQLRHRFL